MNPGLRLITYRDAALGACRAVVPREQSNAMDFSALIQPVRSILRILFRHSFYLQSIKLSKVGFGNWLSPETRALRIAASSWPTFF